MLNSKSIVTPKDCFPRCLPGHVAVMAATDVDFKLISSLSASHFVNKMHLYNSWLSVYEDRCGLRYSIVGPFIGAPYAVMLFETLVSWGVSQFIFVGWCGSISESVSIGDIIIPDGSIIDEGTSSHYSNVLGSQVCASFKLNRNVKDVLWRDNISFHQGIVWTTDAVFRETVDKVEYFKNKRTIAVEMEISALFSVAQFRGVEIAGILIVSDVLQDEKWYPGFKKRSFKKTRKYICYMVNELCCELMCK